MKNIYFITFVLISSILKIFSNEDGKVTITSVFLDEKEEKINVEIEIKDAFDLQHTCIYNVENLLKRIKDKIKDKKINIDEYSLFKIESENNENKKKEDQYNGYDDKILLIKDSTIKLHFEKKKKCKVVIHFNNIEHKKNLKLKSEVNYEYLKYEIEKNFSTEKIKLDNNHYLSHIVKDQKKLYVFNFKIKEDECIEIFINEYLKAHTKLNINNTEFEFVQLNIREKDLKNQASLLILLGNNINNIKNHEILQKKPEYINFSQNYSNYILYNVITGDQNSDPKEYKNINFDYIKEYLQSNKNPSLTINIKNYIGIKIIIDNINNLTFNKKKLYDLQKLTKFECKTIGDLIEKIRKDLEIKVDFIPMEIYKKENNEERTCNNDELLVFDETYKIKFSDKFIKEKGKGKDSKKESEEESTEDLKSKKKKKCLSSNKYNINHKERYNRKL